MHNNDGKIAIIGMSGAFPKASNIHELWKMLLEKRDGLSLVSREEALEAGESPERLSDPDFVPRGGFLDTAETFDEAFFGISPAEALSIDPQQRLFLEHSWLALADAGLEPGAIEKPVGVFAGEGITQYWPFLREDSFARTFENTKYIVGNEKDFLATRTSYKLNLKGPSLDVQSACSTGLVAVGLACQSLLTWGCDLALAGGVMISVPRRTGYVYREGMILSKKGSCRPFDESADGTVFGEGVGIVCLKRLGEALEDGDYVYAVIDAVAINNDGNDKVGFTAPSVSGQADVIEMAHVMADISPDAIGYIETHGTGTHLGDPIEISALKRVFGDRARDGRPCYIGSLKANIGHLDVAAGIASLIKAALIVNSGIIPPQINFDAPNPELGLERSPFAVNKEMVRWEASGSPRIAGVSSFGFGGTNAHAIVESPPAVGARRAEPRPRALLLSARSPSSLDRRRKSIAEYICAHPEVDPLEVAAKASRQRGAFAYRWGAFATDSPAVVREIETAGESWEASASPSCVFLFPGQGSQFPSLAKAYYGALPVFTEWIDVGIAEMDRLGRPGFRELLLEGAPGDSIDETETTQPLLFISEFALAQELISRGIVPAAVSGHSIGEYAAAAVAGVFGFEQGLRLVYRRGYWMQRAPRGAMTAVFLPFEKATAYARDGISVSVVNTSAQTVLSGQIPDIESLEARLSGDGVRYIRLKTSHAFHSPLMDEVLEGFGNDARGIDFHEPRLPFLGNVDGSWWRDGGDWAEYWTSQLRQPVRFDLGMRALAELADPILFEVGPGKALSGFTRAFDGRRMDAIPVLPDATADRRHFEDRVIEGWGRGLPVRFGEVDEVPSSLILLPGYQFDRTRFWPEPKAYARARPAEAAGLKIPRSEIGISASARDRAISAWKRTLGAAPRDLDADFFESGGDSLMAIMLMQSVKSACGVGISLPRFLQEPTPSALVRAVEEAIASKGPEAKASEGPEIGRRADRSTSPLSPQQERLWFLHELDREKPLYNLAHVVRIEGETEVPRLLAALRAFFSRHDVFRARIIHQDGTARMDFAEEAEVPLNQVDLEGDSPEEAERVLADLVRTETRRPIDFSSRPVCGCTVASLPDGVKAVCLVVPHIFTDGWSSEIFLAELRGLYASSAGGSLPAETGIGYGDYAAWEREQRAGWKPSEEDVKFWKEYLKDIPEAHGIPLDFPRPVEPSGMGSTLLFRLGTGLSEKVKSRCEACSMTPSMFFLACLALLVRKCAAQETVVIGTPYANREREELRSVFGYFIRTIPLRFDIDEGMEADAWLSLAKERFLAAWGHSSLGLDELVDILSVPRRANVNPIYQILFAFQSYLGMDRPEGGEESPRFSQTFPDRGVSENDIALYMWESEGFEGAFEYSLDLFERGTIELLSMNFKAVVEAVLNGRGTALRELPLVGDEAMAAIRLSNETSVPEFVGRTFLELFRKSCAAYAVEQAVRFNGKGFSYGDLDRDSELLSRRLQDSGAVPGDFIGVHMRRGYAMLTALIGVMKAGCAYVPLDPRFPADRLRAMVEDSGSRLIVTESALSDGSLFEGRKAMSLIVDVGQAAQADLAGRAPRAIDPGSAAYMLYTSGSTGKPKGVPITHGALANLLLSMKGAPGMTRRDRVLAVTTPAFDISCVELYLALTCGACVAIADDEAAMDPERLGRLIDDERITFLQTTPSRMTLLLESGWKGRPGMKILVGGEAVTMGLAQKMLATGAEAWNGYGPTETAIYSSTCRIEDAKRDVPIGSPIANTRFYVLDESGRMLPPGIQGELAIAGLGLSPGYHGRPDLTEERFIEIAGGMRAYKTGDVAVSDSRGVYRYLGRKDFQVKIRGFRIELGEIEHAIMKYPGILEAACLVWERSENDKRLVAYYRSSEPVDERELSQRLRRALPDYMVPGHFMRLDAFARTSTGKIDRNAFPTPGSQEPAAPRNGQGAIEDPFIRQVLEIWRAILGRDDIGVCEDFFESGGNSLLAVSLIRTMNEKFGHRWRLRDLFEAPTVQKLSSFAGPAGKPARMPMIFKAREGGSKTPLFLVAGAYRNRYYEDSSMTLYEADFLRYFGTILSMIEPDRTVYGLRPRGVYKGERFHASFDAMVDRYIVEILSIQPRGPYIIGGECLGGSLAHALATRLREIRGERVKLILLDSYRTTIRSELDYRLSSLFRLKRRVKSGVKRLSRHPEFRFDTVLELFQWLKIHLFPITEERRERRRLEIGSKRYAYLLLRYRPKVFSGEVLAIINSHWNRASPSLGWDAKLCPHLDIRVVKGNHNNRLTKSAALISKSLKEFFEK